MVEEVTFEQLPALVKEISDRLIRIENKINNFGEQDDSLSKFMSVDEAATFLDLAKSTIYGKVCRRQIPVNKRGKHLYFEKDALVEWIKKGRKRTVEERLNDAQDLLKSKRGL